MATRRRAIRLLVSMSILTLGMAFAAAPASAHTYSCGLVNPKQVNIEVYDGNNLTLYMDWDCNSDTDYSTGLDGCCGNINNFTSSISLRGRTGETWCVRFFTGFAYGGSKLTYRVHNGADVHINTLPSGFNNAISSHNQYRVDWNAQC